MKRRFRQPTLRLMFGIFAIGLLYLTVSRAPIGAIWTAIQRMQLWQFALILGLDAIVVALSAARWWWIVRADTNLADFPSLVLARLSAFGVSYFTLGPQLGGEPLQVLHLRRQGLTYVEATATVIVDKLVELLSGFIFLLLGIGSLVGLGSLGGDGRTWLAIIPLGALAAWPLLHILLLYNHRYPLSAVLGRLRRAPRFRAFVHYIRTCEHLAGRFCRRHPWLVVITVLISVAASAVAVIEYAIIASFLGIGLTAPQAIGSWTAGWLSFLVPLPAGLGAFEASQIWALGQVGVPAAAALGVALVCRGRDLLIGGLGLALSPLSTATQKSKACHEAVQSSDGARTEVLVGPAEQTSAVGEP